MECGVPAYTTYTYSDEIVFQIELKRLKWYKALN